MNIKAFIKQLSASEKAELRNEVSKLNKDFQESERAKKAKFQSQRLSIKDKKELKDSYNRLMKLRRQKIEVNVPAQCKVRFYLTDREKPRAMVDDSYIDYDSDDAVIYHIKKIQQEIDLFKDTVKRLRSKYKLPSNLAVTSQIGVSHIDRYH